MVIKNLESDSNKPSFTFFCINTSLNDYRFCWILNEVLHLNLTRIADVSIEETLQQFTAYQAKENKLNLIYTLLSLKSGNAILIKDLSGFDFIISIEGDVTGNYCSEIVSKVSEITNVILITKLENSLMKAKTLNELTFLIEMTK